MAQVGRAPDDRMAVPMTDTRAPEHDIAPAPPPADDADAGAPAGGADKRRAGAIQPFDFRRPSKFNREHVRALQIVHESFARHFGTILSSTLRTVSHVALTSVSQVSYDNYVKDAPNPALLAMLNLEPLPGAGLLQIPLPVAMSVIDRLLGGSGSGPYPLRPLTDIEDTLIRELLDRGLKELRSAFESLVALEPRIVQIESNPQFAQIAAPSDMVVVMSFDIRIGSEQAGFSLCIPLSSLQPVLERFVASSAERPSGDRLAMVRAVETALDRVPVEVRVRFSPTTLTSREIVGLQPGDIVALRHHVDEPLVATAGGIGVLAARGGRRGNRLAFRIVDPETT